MSNSKCTTVDHSHFVTPIHSEAIAKAMFEAFAVSGEVPNTKSRVVMSYAPAQSVIDANKMNSGLDLSAVLHISSGKVLNAFVAWVMVMNARGEHLRLSTGIECHPEVVASDDDGKIAVRLHTGSTKAGK